MSSKLLNKRESNLELFRIIIMLLIVAHHYVVNSGIYDLILNSSFCLKNVYLLLFGAWGKIGINCFVFITGYFMCKSNITIKKFLKLLCEVLFYNIIIGLVFIIFGYTEFSIKSIVSLFIPIKNIDTDFIPAYLLFYLAIPFLNVLLNNINKIMHIKLLILVSFAYIFLGSFPLFSVTMNYFSWFIVLYFISSYIRLYPLKIFNNIKFWLITSVLLVLICCASIICCYALQVNPYYFVIDSNKILATLTGLSLFMLFKNIKVPYNRFINTVAASTFGVLLIHANSYEMRKWLWQDVFNNTAVYDTNLIYVHSLICVLIVYIVCTVIDYIRIKLIEKNLLPIITDKVDRIKVLINKKFFIF